MVTQQYVKLEDSYALTDIYFPQFNIHVEIDEIEKIDLNQVKREAEIEIVSKKDIVRISCWENPNKVDEKIDLFVEEITKKREEMVRADTWIPWSWHNEFDGSRYTKAGKLDVNDKPVFKKIVHACNLLGQNYKDCQRAWVKSKKYTDLYLWFPKMYPNKDWSNEWAEDGTSIIEKKIVNGVSVNRYIPNAEERKHRVVFARSKDNLGYIFYRFQGVYAVDEERTAKDNGVVYKRISKVFELDEGNYYSI